jgi:hypothetical protein
MPKESIDQEIRESSLYTPIRNASIHPRYRSRVANRQGEEEGRAWKELERRPHRERSWESERNWTWSSPQKLLSLQPK